MRPFPVAKERAFAEPKVAAQVFPWFATLGSSPVWFSVNRDMNMERAAGT
jgi:hypothetical protein